MDKRGILAFLLLLVGLGVFLIFNLDDIEITGNAIIAHDTNAEFTSGSFSNVSMVDGSLALNRLIPVGNYSDSTPPYSIDGVTDILVLGNYTYVVSSPDYSLTILDTSNKSNPIAVGNYVNNTMPYSIYFASGVAVAGDYAYVTSHSHNTIAILNITNKSNPIFAGNYYNLSYSYDVRNPIIFGDYLYVTQFNGAELVVFNITNRTNIVPIGNYTDSDSPYSVHLAYDMDISESGDYVYIPSGSDNELTIINATNKSNLVPVGNYSIPAGINRVAASGNYLYGASDDSLIAFDVSNKSNPVIVDTYSSVDLPYSTEGVYSADIFIDGDFLFASSQSDYTIIMFNITNRSKLVPIAEYGVGRFSPYSVWQSQSNFYLDGYLYASSTYYDSITIFKDEYFPFGTYVSPILDLGSEAVLNNFSWTEYAPYGTNWVSFRGCDDSGCDGESWESWSTDNPIDLSGVSNNKYFQYKFLLNTTNSSVSPVISNIMLDYQYPILINVSTDSSSYSLGSDVTFTAHWNSSDTVRLLISEDSSFDNCNYSVQSGCLAYSALDSTSPTSAVLSNISSNVTWYARICDSEVCSPVNKYFLQGNNYLSDSDAIFYGEDGGDDFGWSVSMDGDVNGDGYDDVLIGARYNDEGGANAGKMYLILGSESGRSSPINVSNSNASFIGSESSAALGYNQYLDANTVSMDGDVNGDGYDDMLFSSMNTGGSGVVYLIFGRSTGWENNINVSNQSYIDVSFVGETSGDSAGWSASIIGDVNNDSYDDVLIGAANGHGTDGEVYLVLGRPTGWVSEINLSNASYVGASWYGEDGGKLGSSVKGGGDVNGDGYGDIVISDIDGGYGGDLQGETYLIFGRSTGWGLDLNISEVCNASFHGEYHGDDSGHSVSNTGDYNGDGYDDILIGAPLNEDGGAYVGKSYLVFGRSSGWQNNVNLSNGTFVGASFISSSEYEESPYSLADAGDVNSDGYSDVIISGVGWPNGDWDGRAYLILGKSSGWSMNFNLSNADSFFNYEESGDHAGWGVAGAGDYNGDGYGDLLISAEDAADGTGSSYPGRAYVVFGGVDSETWGSFVVSDSCVEDWSCSDWSTCSSSSQSRTCVDANSCGTTDSRPSLTQSCTVDTGDTTTTTGGGGGGGSTTPTTTTEDNETEAVQVTEIVNGTATAAFDGMTPNKTSYIVMNDSSVGLTNIAIDVGEEVEGASITIEETTDQSDANLELSIGDSFVVLQTFNVVKNNVTNEQIEDVEINFRIEKSVIEEAFGPLAILASRFVKLYKRETVDDEWARVDTEVVDEDSTYYYYAAYSDGFSQFVMGIDSSPLNCEEGEKRCIEGAMRSCVGDNKWEVLEICENGCGSETKCQSSFEFKTSYFVAGGLILIFAFGIIILIRYSKKRLESNGMSKSSNKNIKKAKESVGKKLKK